MADNHHHHHHHNQEGLNDDFLEQILAIPSYPGTNNDGNLAGTTTTSSMILQLNNSTDTTTDTTSSYHHGHGGGGTLFSPPLGLSLGETATGGFMKPDEASGSGNRFSGVDDHHHLLLNTTDHHHHLQQIGGGIPSSGGKNDRGGGGGVHLTGLFPAFGHVQTHSGRPTISHHHQVHQPFHGQPTPAPVAAAPHPPAIRPRVRARRGQATDPHSIAERLRRERIAERMKALQELVPSSNKTDRAAMLDEIVDYVKFLRLQVKVLSMSRLGGAGAVAQLVADTPLSSIEGEAGEGGSNQETWEKWSNDGTEQQVAKLMEEDVGAAMQFLQSKALCIMPISLATAIYHTHQTDNSGMIKPEPNAHS